jgi:hypothetical protein
MLTGKRAQLAEFLSLVCLLSGVAALCQPWSMVLYTQGFKLLLAGWIGLNIFSHRKPVI